MSHAVSPLAPKVVPVLPPIAGCRIATASAGIKYKNRTDVLVMVFDRPAAVAGVFTRSKCPSAPVDLCRRHLSGQSARVLVVNSGNANAFTGQKGVDTVTATASAAAQAAGCASSEVFLSSTGVIGEPLDAGKITAVLPAAFAEADPDGWMKAALAIMTTDTYPKLATASATIDGATVSVNGIAKGAGMIAPDMATMLSYVVTDAPLSASMLQGELSRLVKTTFNAITVDSDTSTSDTLMAFATGGAKLKGGAISHASDPRLAAFRTLLKQVLSDLALQVVRDGEGARKMMEVRVKGAKSAKAARVIARSIANSPLVKTAIAGEDANWGRVVMAVGKAGEVAERDRLSISFGPNRVAHLGARDPDYSEADVSAYMTGDHIVITADLGLGTGSATIWTCDLTKEYVAINGDYRS
jgi:glutamate N-acetyltransferase / amino-acid N-acetyltransferase